MSFLQWSSPLCRCAFTNGAATLLWISLRGYLPLKNFATGHFWRKCPAKNRDSRTGGTPAGGSLVSGFKAGTHIQFKHLARVQCIPCGGFHSHGGQLGYPKGSHPAIERWDFPMEIFTHHFWDTPHESSWKVSLLIVIFTIIHHDFPHCSLVPIVPITHHHYWASPMTMETS